MLRVTLLGHPKIMLDNQTINVVRRKSRALFYYLASNARPVKREHLVGLFWPDLERTSALQNLRTTLHGLRKQFGQALWIDEDELGLAPDSQVDCLIFAKRLASLPNEIAQVQEALDLYQGEFLQNFSLPDLSKLEDWLVIEREHYRRLALRGLAHLSRLYEAIQDYASALVVVERALSFDQLQEDLQRESIRLMYLSGDRPGAIRQYDHLRRLLDEEMGVPPMTETRKLYDAILQDRHEELVRLGARGRPLQVFSPANTQEAPASPARSAETFNLPFTGREAELQELALKSGPGYLVLVEGEPGIGKTRLVEEFLRTSDDLPLMGAGRELERSLPYQPVIEALRSLLARPEWRTILPAIHQNLPGVWLAETARLLPELNPSQGRLAGHLTGADESRLWEGVYQFLLALSRLQPVTLFIDDLHWVDASTLGLLGYLVRQGGGNGQRYLAACRPAPVRTPVAALTSHLTREGRLVRIPLERLSEADVINISQQISPEYAHPLASWLLLNSEGSPFVLEELLRYAREQRILVNLPGEETDTVINLNQLSASPVVPHSVYSLIQSRFEILSESARRILGAAVASGREFSFAIVAPAAALSETAAMDALDELHNAGLISPVDGQRYRFDHPLTMEVAFQELGEPRYRLLRRRVAEAMEQAYPQSKLDEMAGIVASHYSEGMAFERAAPYALRAGQQAASLAAWSEAIQFYEQAIPGSQGMQRYAALMGLGDAHIQAGNTVQASEAYREALSMARSIEKTAEAWNAQLALARSFLPQARFHDVIQLVKEVRHNGRPEDAMSAEFLWGTALSLEGADLDAAAWHLQLAESLCDQTCKSETGNQQTDMARIKFELGSVAAQQGDLEKAIALYRQARELACKVEDELGLPWCVLANNNLAYHLHLLGNPDAEEYARQGLHLAQEKGLLGQQPYLYSTLGEIALAKGDLDQADEHFQRGLELSKRLSIAERVAGLTANLGRLAAQRGEEVIAIHRLSSALAKAEDLGVHHLAAHIRLWLAPLLPPGEGRQLLETTLLFAQSTGRHGLLEQVQRSLK